MIKSALSILAITMVGFSLYAQTSPIFRDKILRDHPELKNFQMLFGKGNVKLDSVLFYTDYIAGDSLLRGKFIYDYFGDTLEIVTYNFINDDGVLAPNSRYTIKKDSLRRVLFFQLEYVIDGQLTPTFVVKQFPSNGGLFPWDSIKVYNYNFDTKLLYYEALEYGYTVNEKGQLTDIQYIYFKSDGSINYFAKLRQYFDNLGRYAGRSFRTAYPGQPFKPSDSTSVTYTNNISFNRQLTYLSGQWKNQIYSINVPNDDSTRIVQYEFTWESSEYRWSMSVMRIEEFDQDHNSLVDIYVFNPYSEVANIYFDLNYWADGKLDYEVEKIITNQGENILNSKAFYFYSGMKPPKRTKGLSEQTPSSNALGIEPYAVREKYPFKIDTNLSDLQTPESWRRFIHRMILAQPMGCGQVTQRGAGQLRLDSIYSFEDYISQDSQLRIKTYMKYWGDSVEITDVWRAGNPGALFKHINSRVVAKNPAGQIISEKNSFVTEDTLREQWRTEWYPNPSTGFEWDSILSFSLDQATKKMYQTGKSYDFQKGAFGLVHSKFTSYFVNGDIFNTGFHRRGYYDDGRLESEYTFIQLPSTMFADSVHYYYVEPVTSSEWFYQSGPFLGNNWKRSNLRMNIYGATQAPLGVQIDYEWHTSLKSLQLVYTQINAFDEQSRIVRTDEVASFGDDLVSGPPLNISTYSYIQDNLTDIYTDYLADGLGGPPKTILRNFYFYSEAGGSGVRETAEEIPVKIAPNPNDGTFRIEADGRTIEHIMVYNSLGQLVESHHPNAFSFNMSIPSSGMYMIGVYTPAGYSAKWVYVE